MPNRYSVVLCRRVDSKLVEKLYVLAGFAHQDVDDIGSLIMEQAIGDAWEGYRNNPKHRQEIEEWEKEHKP